jgi:hypothetical protein
MDESKEKLDKKLAVDIILGIFGRIENEQIRKNLRKKIEDIVSDSTTNRSETK